MYDVFVGFGGVGCNIVRAMERLASDEKAYRYIDSKQQEGQSVTLRVYDSPEEQEQKCSVAPVKALFRRLRGKVLVVMTGTSKIAPSSLRALEIVTNKFGSENVSVLYVRPEDMMRKAGISRMMDRAVFGVLQEYARSGQIDEMLVVDNSMMEKIITDANLLNYHMKNNELLAYSLMMCMELVSRNAVYGVSGEFANTSRIKTIGVFDQDNGESFWFYNLDAIDTIAKVEIRHYFLCGQDRLTNVEYMRKVREMMIDKAYAVYDAGDYVGKYGYCIAAVNEPFLYDVSLNNAS